jgi:hypothetical protein
MLERVLRPEPGGQRLTQAVKLFGILTRKNSPGAVSPWMRAFWLRCALPSSVREKVLPCAFKRFASLWRSLAGPSASKQDPRLSLNGPKRHEAGANLGSGAGRGHA